MSAIKNVIVVGASCYIGSFGLKQLLASGKFTVSVLKRVGSTSTYAAGATVVEADFSSVESLKAAFKGQDAVVSFINDAGVPGQKLMVDAAIATGVKRFLPSNFGSNMADPTIRKLPIFGGKIAVEDYLVEKSKTSDLTYTFVYNGPFLEYCIGYKVLLDTTNYQPPIYDGGDIEFSGTSEDGVGEAVVGVLEHPEETKNRAVYVSQITLSQNKLLALAKKIAPEKPWAPVPTELEPVALKAQEKLLKGEVDGATIVMNIVPSILGKGETKFPKTDNELLGVKQKSDDYITEILKKIV